MKARFEIVFSMAVLASGKTYVILHPAYPEERNLKIAGLAGLHDCDGDGLKQTVILHHTGLHKILSGSGITHCSQCIEYQFRIDCHSCFVMVLYLEWEKELEMLLQNYSLCI